MNYVEKNLQTTEEMDEWLKKNQIKYDKIENSEQMAKSRIGEELYNKLVKNYTFKQWNKYPEELDPSVLARIRLEIILILDIFLINIKHYQKMVIRLL